jgi:hypothetical protein
MELYLAFTLGLFGSLHCVGMCGPILFALPQAERLSSQLAQRTVYHLTRSFAYACLGLVLGFFGDFAVLLGAQKFISLASGFIILFIVVFRSKWNGVEQWLYKKRSFAALRGAMAKLINNKSFFGQAKLGFLNGLLPCGFVYVALVASFNQASAIKGALFMLLFGIGTMPLLLAYSVFSAKLRQIKLLKSRVFSASFSLLLASFFILRGLELGIPFLSPEFAVSHEHIESSCCEK